MEGLAVKTRSKNHTAPETASVLGLWGLTIGPDLYKGPSDQNPIKTSTPMLRMGSTPWQGRVSDPDAEGRGQPALVIVDGAAGVYTPLA